MHHSVSSSRPHRRIVERVVFTALIFVFGVSISAFPASASSRGPLAVDIVSFTAETTSNSIVVEWETASEFDAYRFVVYRGTKSVPEEPMETVCEKYPSGGSTGAIYECVDNKALVPGVSYYYWLYDFDPNSDFTSRGADNNPVVFVGTPTPTATVPPGSTSTPTPTATPTSQFTLTPTPTPSVTPTLIATRAATSTPTAISSIATNTPIPSAATSTPIPFSTVTPIVVVSTPTFEALTPSVNLITLTPDANFPTPEATLVITETPFITTETPSFLETPTLDSSQLLTPPATTPTRLPPRVRPEPTVSAVSNGFPQNVAAAGLLLCVGGGAILGAVLLGVVGFVLWRRRPTTEESESDR